MTESATAQPLFRGLKDVVIDKTSLCLIDGEAGRLFYRGYDIHDLAEQSTFEEVAYLLWHGSLPTASQLEQFETALRDARTLPPQVIDVIRLTSSAHPMDVLRTAVSALAAYDPDVNDTANGAKLRKAVRLTAQVPAIVAAHDRIRRGEEPVHPAPDLSQAANFLYTLHGARPDPEAARAIDVDFILHAEHGSNASSFSARVTASTLADIHAAIVSAIGALKGPRHGGAAEAVMKLVQEIEEPERAKTVIARKREHDEKIMGFGHRVYRVEDPRARHMRERARQLGEMLGQPKWYRILEAIEEAMAPLAVHGVNVNVDFYAGAVYYLLGIPEDLFVPMFAIGRTPGWIAQVLEQWQDNTLIRPRLMYEGPENLPYLPIDERV